MIEREYPVKKRSDENYGQINTNRQKKNFFVGFVPAAFRDHVPLLYAVYLWNNINRKAEIRSGFFSGRRSAKLAFGGQRTRWLFIAANCWFQMSGFGCQEGESLNPDTSCETTVNR
jgi:hypothetical protein